MAAVDLMRHWGSRVVDEPSYSESPKQNERLSMIAEETSVDLCSVDEEDLHSEHPEINDEEYGYSSSSDDDDDDDSRNDDLSNDEGRPAVKKSAVHASRQTPLFNITGAPVLGDTMTNNTGGQQGMYRTVSAFGGIFDMADPIDYDSNSCSTDFSDDFTPEEPAPRKVTKKQSVPRDPISSSSSLQTQQVAESADPPHIPSIIAFSKAFDALDETENLVNELLQELESMHFVAQTLYDEAAECLTSSKQTMDSVFLDNVQVAS